MKCICYVMFGAVELKLMGLWNNVVTIQTSDFARTLNPNSGDGTGELFIV